MQSRARFLSHPIHQIVIVFPLGLFFTSAIFDLIGLATSSSRWNFVASYMIGAGLVGGVAAAVAGLVDYLAIPARTRARKIGMIHGIASLGMVAMFGIGGWLRMGQPSHPTPVALLFSWGGVLVGAAAGWLGGELVTRMGIGVDPDAGLDAPGSFTRTVAPARPASSPAQPVATRVPEHV